VRIVTFNSHQGYVFLLCKLPFEFFIVEPKVSPWDLRSRPLPENARLVTLEAARNLIAAQEVDLAICHNSFDLIDLRDFDLPKILVIHLSLAGRIAAECAQISPAEFIATLQMVITKMGVHVVHTTARRAEEWGIPGTLIDLAVDPDEYRGYHGSHAMVLRVGHRLRELAATSGYYLQEKILGSLPSTIIGNNPLLPNACILPSYEAFRKAYREHRLYLSTLDPNFTEGISLSFLEAMATGMPIVSTLNRYSPIVDGVNGFISDDLTYLRGCVSTLLADIHLARRMGQRARETACEQFHIRKFHEAWQGLIARIVGSSKKAP